LLSAFADFAPFLQQLLLCFFMVFIGHNAIAYGTNCGALGRFGILYTIGAPVRVDHVGDITLGIEVAIHAYADVAVLALFSIGDSTFVDGVIYIACRLTGSAAGAFIIVDSKCHLILIGFLI
jgi:hypothetical protein